MEIKYQTNDKSASNFPFFLDVEKVTFYVDMYSSCIMVGNQSLTCELIHYLKNVDAVNRLDKSFGSTISIPTRTSALNSDSQGLLQVLNFTN